MLTVGVFVFGFAMIILAITIVSMRVGHSNRELAKLRKRSDLQQRESGVAQADVDAVRRAAVVEALRRDPSLRDASDPESLRRLSALIEEVQEKLQLAGELNLVRRTEEDQSRWDDQRAATDRKAAEQRLEADRKAAERKAQVDAMPPFRRRIVRNPLISGLVARPVARGSSPDAQPGCRDHYYCVGNWAELTPSVWHSNMTEMRYTQ